MSWFSFPACRLRWFSALIFLRFLIFTGKKSKKVKKLNCYSAFLLPCLSFRLYLGSHREHRETEDRTCTEKTKGLRSAKGRRKKLNRYSAFSYPVCHSVFICTVFGSHREQRNGEIIFKTHTNTKCVSSKHDSCGALTPRKQDLLNSLSTQLLYTKVNFSILSE